MVTESAKRAMRFEEKISEREEKALEKIWWRLRYKKEEDWWRGSEGDSSKRLLVEKAGL